MTQNNKRLTDAECRDILAMPKAIGEVIEWTKVKDRRPFEQFLRATIVPVDRPGFERDLVFFGERYKSRVTQRFVWSLGIVVSGIRPNLIRFDNHDNPHLNRADGTVVEGCMMHVWSEAHADRYAVPAGDIVDCTSVESALKDVLQHCNINTIHPLQTRLEGMSNG